MQSNLKRLLSKQAQALRESETKDLHSEPMTDHDQAGHGTGTESSGQVPASSAHGDRDPAIQEGDSEDFTGHLDASDLRALYTFDSGRTASVPASVAGNSSASLSGERLPSHAPRVLTVSASGASVGSPA